MGLCESVYFLFVALPLNWYRDGALSDLSYSLPMDVSQEWDNKPRVENTLKATVAIEGAERRVPSLADVQLVLAVNLHAALLVVPNGVYGSRFHGAITAMRRFHFVDSLKLLTHADLLLLQLLLLLLFVLLLRFLCLLEQGIQAALHYV